MTTFSYFIKFNINSMLVVANDKIVKMRLFVFKRNNASFTNIKYFKIVQNNYFICDIYNACIYNIYKIQSDIITHLNDYKKQFNQLIIIPTSPTNTFYIVPIIYISCPALASVTSNIVNARRCRCVTGMVSSAFIDVCHHKLSCLKISRCRIFIKL